ncbi:MAG TPA: DUF2799 domain-containing protein [Gammaproteobacteria bacterium]|nr:DUF2799 domain-containing protein [Gammaproteobacteria bacterium]
MTAKKQDPHFRLHALLTVIFLVTGCASLSKDECQTANWKTIGYEDGVQGKAEARIGAHRKACAEYGVAPDLEAYRSGRDEGLASFCQPGNGYQQGRSGKQYAGVCPDQLEADFLQAYRDGRKLYELETEISRLSQQLKSQRKRLTKIDVKMRNVSAELVAENIPVERRVVLVDKLRSLGEESAAVKARIPELEKQLENRKQRVTALSGAGTFQGISVR